MTAGVDLTGFFIFSSLFSFVSCAKTRGETDIQSCPENLEVQADAGADSSKTATIEKNIPYFVVITDTLQGGYTIIYQTI